MRHFTLYDFISTHPICLCDLHFNGFEKGPVECKKSTQVRMNWSEFMWINSSNEMAAFLQTSLSPKPHDPHDNHFREGHSIVSRNFHNTQTGIRKANHLQRDSSMAHLFQVLFNLIFRNPFSSPFLFVSILCHSPLFGANKTKKKNNLSKLFHTWKSFLNWDVPTGPEWWC